MVLHYHISVQFSESVSTICHQVNNALLPSLEEQHQPEFAVIKFAHAATNPKAVVVKLANTPLALTAVSRSKRHKLLASLTKTLSWHHYILFLSSLVNFGVFCILSH